MVQELGPCQELIRFEKAINLPGLGARSIGLLLNLLVSEIASCVSNCYLRISLCVEAFTVECLTL